MSFQIFDVFGDIRFEGMDQVMSQLTNLGNGLTSLGGQITNFGNKLINGMTKPIVGLIEQGITYNSTIEDLQTAFEVMLGSEEKAIDMTAKLKEMGAKTPFEVVGLAQATKTLLNYGYTNENVLPIMSKLGDVALGNNDRLQGLAVVMGQVNSLGRLQAGDLNQLINRGWNPLNEISKRTGETMEQLRDRMKDGKLTYKEVQQALEDATSAGGKFYQGMEKGSETLSGKLSTLKDNFNEFLGSAVKPISDWLSNVLIPKLTELAGWFGNLSQETKTAILVFAGLLAGIGPVVLVLGLMVTALGALLSPLGLVIGAVGLLAGGFLLNYIHAESLQGAFTMLIFYMGELKKFVMDTLVPALRYLATGEGLEKVQNAAGITRQKVEDLRIKFIEFKDQCIKVWEWLMNVKDICEKNLPPVLDSLKKLWEELKKAGKNFSDVLKQIQGSAGDANTQVKGTAKAVKDLVDAFTQIVSWGNKVVSTIVSIDKWCKNASKSMKDFFYSAPGLGSLYKGLDNLLGFAGGTNYAPGGYAIVGEEGPEIVRLERGSQVYTASETQKMLNNRTTGNYNTSSITNINVNLIATDLKDLMTWEDFINRVNVEAVTRGGI